MIFNEQGSARWIAGALLLTVATQLFYITVVSGSDVEALRPITWMIEMAAFTLVSVAALALAGRARTANLVWSAIAVSGIFNGIQVAMGLSMFGPAREAANVEQLFGAILAGAFFFFFAAKVLLGLAAIAFGLSALRGSGLAKIVGGLAALAGLAAVIVNILAMATGMEYTFPAGATGTAATALLAITILVAPVTGDAAD